VQRFDDRPITEASEVEAFLDRAPFVVDRAEFARFVLGFPHQYLKQTAPAEVLKHFTLVQSLGRREVISTLSREAERWKLVVVTHDRRFLFSRIAGSLSLFGANILDAEAIGNTGDLVLDVFRVAGHGHRFAQVPERRRFLKFLEEVVTGARDLDAAIAEAEGAAPPLPAELRLEWDEPDASQRSRLRVRGRDSPGILYRITRGLSAAGCDIELARIETPEGEVRDEFQLSFEGGRVPPEQRAGVEAAVTSSLAPRRVGPG
jgi:[protein-PII] uridylyltransferase